MHANKPETHTSPESIKQCLGQLWLMMMMVMMVVMMVTMMLLFA
jgi:hypothetical protein